MSGKVSMIGLSYDKYQERYKYKRRVAKGCLHVIINKASIAIDKDKYSSPPGSPGDSSRSGKSARPDSPTRSMVLRTK